MVVNIKQNGSAHVLELSNRASVHKIEGESLSAFTVRMDNHESGLNANAHGISNIAGLQTALNGKSNTGHGHTQGEISGLSGSLANKSDVGHVHSIANVTNLQTTLDGKAGSVHTHVIGDVTGLQIALDGKQDTISGYTGSVTFVKTVDFTGHTVTTGTINVSNGIITSIS